MFYHHTKAAYSLSDNTVQNGSADGIHAVRLCNVDKMNILEGNYIVC